jgi:hypothetical protein
MKTTRLVIVAAASLLALAACHKSPQAQAVENAGDKAAAAIDNQADALDAAAGNVGDAASATLENQADNLHAAADNVSDAADAKADAINKNAQ